MEFPNIGTRCSANECRQLDFLSFTCSYCSNIFCKEHFHVISHLCSKFINNIATRNEITTTSCCSQEFCTKKSLIKISCIKCYKHFCIQHRIHDCCDKVQDKKKNILKNWTKPKQEFLEAKTGIDQEITSILKKSKNFAMANKVQLMRIKIKSSGPNNIPITERCYFLVHPPINYLIKTVGGSKAVFVSVNWSIGKIIDSLAISLNIPNSNNIVNVKKLRMFHYLTGNIVTNQMDIILSEMLNIKNLINGQDIVLEYSNEDKINCSLYK